MKAYLIDPIDRKISEVEYSGNYTHIYDLIDCGTFDLVQLNDRGDGVYVDGEGLINGKDRYIFNIMGEDFSAPAYLCGKALVLGSDEDGNATEPKMSLQELKGSVMFLGLTL